MILWPSFSCRTVPVEESHHRKQSTPKTMRTSEALRRSVSWWSRRLRLERQPSEEPSRRSSSRRWLPTISVRSSLPSAIRRAKPSAQPSRPTGWQRYRQSQLSRPKTSSTCLQVYFWTRHCLVCTTETIGIVFWSGYYNDDANDYDDGGGDDAVTMILMVIIILTFV